MTIPKFIEKAIEGGWTTYTAGVGDTRVECLGLQEGHEFNYRIRSLATGREMNVPIHVILVDPEAWKAVGKVEGWENVEKMHAKGGSPHREDLCWCSGYTWDRFMHAMIDALAEGKSIEDYLATL